MTKTEDTSMRVLKTATCKTITGKSTLTYHVGASPDDEIHVRIHANDGGGMFSQEWVSFEAVQEALKDDREGAAITSVRLTSLFKGKSVNTPSFLLAALKHLKLVRAIQGKQRHHERLDPRPFLDQMEKLMSSSAAVKTKSTVTKTTRVPTKKTATKKRAITKKKTATRTATTKKASQA